MTLRTVGLSRVCPQCRHLLANARRGCQVEARVHQLRATSIRNYTYRPRPYTSGGLDSITRRLQKDQTQRKQHLSSTSTRHDSEPENEKTRRARVSTHTRSSTAAEDASEMDENLEHLLDEPQPGDYEIEHSRFPRETLDGDEDALQDSRSDLTADDYGRTGLLFPRETFDGDEDALQDSRSDLTADDYGRTGLPFPREREEYKPRRARPRQRTGLNWSLIRHEPLNTTALGSRMDALILSNPNLLGLAKSTRLVPGNTVKGRHAHRESELERLLKELGHYGDSTHGQMDMQRAVQHIEELRPEMGTTLNDAQYDELMEQLRSSFTKPQLSHYLSLVNNAKDIVSTRESDLKCSWLVREGGWAPLQPLWSSTGPPKQRVVATILHSIWKVERSSNEDQVGRASFWIHPVAMDILFRSSGSIVEAFQAEYLTEDEGEKLVAAPDEPRLDLVSQKQAVPVFLEFLERFASRLGTMTSQIVPVKHVPSVMLSPENLKELGRVTQSSITLYKPESTSSADKPNVGKSIELHWFTNQLTESGDPFRLETTPDIVLRLLRGRPSQQAEATGSRDVTLLAEPAAQGIWYLYKRETRSMAWEDKRHSWYRWAYPLGKAADDGPLKDDLPVAAANLIDPSSTSMLGGVAEDSIHRIKATFGHVLSTQQDPDPQSVTGRCILAPAMPHPKLLEALTPSEKHQQPVDEKQQHEPLEKETPELVTVQPQQESPSLPQRTIVLNFVPEVAKDPFKHADGLPEVQLRLPLDANVDFDNFSIPHNSTLTAVIHANNRDVLIPSAPVDFRLTHQVRTPLPFSPTSQASTPNEQPQELLMEYLAACKFDLARGRLQAPPETSIKLPRPFIRQDGAAAKQTLKTCVYRFAGFEVHHATDVPFRGYILRYSSIAGDEQTGHRQELSLQVPEDLDACSIDGLQSFDQAGFVAAAKDIALGRAFKWYESAQSEDAKSSQSGRRRVLHGKSAAARYDA